MLIWGLRACAAVAGSVVLLIVLFLVTESLPVLGHMGWSRFLTDASWHPAGDAAEGTFNLTPIVVGTLATTAGSVMIVVPLGLISAVFCCYYAPPVLARCYRRLIELLAGIPSVVYGFWGLVVLVPLVRRFEPPGPSLLAGVLILTVMILPTIALTAEAAMMNVPRAYLHGAAALGLSKRATLWGVVIPAAKSGVLTGVILGIGRAIGETMAILMVCGNIVQVPTSVFDPVRTLTANIALEMAYAMGDHRSALFVSGLVLMGLIMVLVIVAETISKRESHG